MKISYNWLKQYFKSEVSSEAILDAQPILLELRAPTGEILEHRRVRIGAPGLRRGPLGQRLEHFPSLRGAHVELLERLRGVGAGVGEHVEDDAAARVLEVGDVVLDVVDADPSLLEGLRELVGLELGDLGVGQLRLVAPGHGRPNGVRGRAHGSIDGDQG